ncbi:MAG: CHAT domain-containing protein, partial [Nannocystaceae bacterium]
IGRVLDYTLRGSGGGREEFQIDWKGELAKFATLSSESEPADLPNIGDLLQEMLPAGWKVVEEQIKSVPDDQLVFITVRSNAAELYALPWELVTIGKTSKRLGTLPGVVLRYEWPETKTTPSRPGGGRTLFAWSNAGGPVPHEGHLKAIGDAYREGGISFDPDRDVLACMNALALDQALSDATTKNNPYSILHILAHGTAIGSTFGLLLDAHDAVDAEHLTRILEPHASTLRLVVLASCDGGNTGAFGNHLGSLAQALHRVGIQSVVASRYWLSSQGSTTFTTTLYDSLLVQRRSLEQAFNDARTRLKGRPGLDWASMQLYARASDGNDNRLIPGSCNRVGGLAARIREAVRDEPQHLNFIGFPPDVHSKPMVDRADVFVAPILSGKQGGKEDQFDDLVASCSTAATAVHAVILGEPGSGKSTLCRVLARKAARDEQGRAPLQLRVRELLADDHGEVLLELVARQLRRRNNLGVDTEALKQLCAEGQALLLVDGLDEAGDSREQLGEQLHSFAGAYASAPLVVTSRRVDYDAARIGPGRLVELHLELFDDHRLSLFIERWYAAEIPDDADERARRLASLRAAFKARPQARALARNPLLATLVVLVHYSDATGELPTRR